MADGESHRVGSHSPRAIGLVPHLFVKDVPAALRFYRGAFGAAELFRNVLPSGAVLFVELALGDVRLLISEELPQLDAIAPNTQDTVPMLLVLETGDPDELARRVVRYGGRIEFPVQEMFFGERYGRVTDPFGYRWALSTKREQFTPADIDSRTPRTI